MGSGTSHASVASVGNIDDASNEMTRGTDKRVNIADPFAKRLMVRYLGRREADIELLRSALDGNDFKRIRVTGHNMCGSGSAYGLDRVSELGDLLENAAIARNFEQVHEIIDTLEAYLHGLKIA